MKNILSKFKETQFYSFLLDQLAAVKETEAYNLFKEQIDHLTSKQTRNSVKEQLAKFKIPKKYQRKYVLPGMMLFFCAIFLVSAGVLINRAIEDQTQAKQNNHLASLVQQQGEVQRPPVSGGDTTFVEPVSAFVEIAHPVTGEPVKVLREYAPVYQLNPDMVGWISVPNTALNYPVLQTPEDPDYYLHRDFYEKNSRHGTVYAHSEADVHAPSDNVTIYGHNMTDGSMFAVLHKYTDKSYWEANPYIYFDTLYEHRTYQILSVFEINVADSVFAYHNLVEANAFSFQNYMKNCQELSLYDTGVTAKYGDKLITLSTCDKDTSNDDIRFVVVAKLVS